MASFDGSMRTPKNAAIPIRVVVDLPAERVSVTSEGIPIAEWRLGEAQISAHKDGFHMRRGGEEVVITIKEDAELAVMLDLRSVPIDLARRMAIVRDGRTR